MFEFTELDRQKVENGYFYSVTPPRLRLFPPKQKKQYIALTMIAKAVDPTKKYTEKEISALFKEIYPDFVTIRRGMIDYQLMERTKDGSLYWLKKKD